MALKILTANRLNDGCVVWYAGDAGWVEDVTQAFIARDGDDKTHLEIQAQTAVAANLVVEAALIDVTEEAGVLHALRLRERIRLEGPSIAYGLKARHYSERQVKSRKG